MGTSGRTNGTFLPSRRRSCSTLSASSHRPFQGERSEHRQDDSSYPCATQLQSRFTNVLLFTCSQALTPYSVCLHDHSSCLSTPELPINTPSRIVRWGYMSVYNRAIFMFVAIHTRFQHKFQFAASLTCFLLSKKLYLTSPRINTLLSVRASMRRCHIVSVST